MSGLEKPVNELEAAAYAKAKAAIDEISDAAEQEAEAALRRTGSFIAWAALGLVGAFVALAVYLLLKY